MNNIIEFNNFKWKIEQYTIATHSNNFNNYAIEIQCLQFLIRFTFALAINKAQGQSLQMFSQSHMWPIYTSKKLIHVYTRHKN